MSDRLVPKVIRQLMPDATDVELKAALENYMHYLRVLRRIIERTKQQSLRPDSPDSDRGRTLGDNPPNV